MKPALTAITATLRKPDTCEGNAVIRTVSMMQPYLFPYLGYFQLIAHSDAFVLGDDLQYVKASWINRNRVLVNGQARTIAWRRSRPYSSITLRQRSSAADVRAGGVPARGRSRAMRLVSHADGPADPSGRSRGYWKPCERTRE